MPQEEWKYQFGRMTRARYPELQEVHLLDGDSLWPTNERDIKKSPWPRYAEQLAAEGITLLDHEGKSWRPRLTTRKHRG
ncbi:hypothetical protein EXIGLDRAFT_476684 [Exidia glandulosa HHB12029]|uniref:Uncharacterized protein n=1 Tax=Exidia glandulosa HHB12029 TaxID=1314781 RepID=A0A165JVA1_EXIGL|nr:hypothetical protein EXIGLDRAFT_476684 [Exidia glandulosa HHB12029]